MNKSQNCVFYIVRHGETDWNAKRIVLGQKDGAVLSSLGLKQTQNLKTKLRRVKFSAAYSSGLKRTNQTAEIILGGRNIKINKSKPLLERSYGRFEGKPADNYEKAMGEKFKKRDKLTGMARMKFKPASDVESDFQVFNRFSKKLKQIAQKHRGENILIVTHGGCIRTFLVSNSFAQHHQLPKDNLLFGGYIKVESDGKNFSSKLKGLH